MTVRQAIRSALALLTRRDRRLLGLSVMIQMGTSLLDLVGVLLVGLVGALAVTTVQSQPPPAMVETLARVFDLSDVSNQSLVLILAGIAAIVLLTKSILSTYLSRRVLLFLANRQALVSARLTRELLSRPLTFVQKRSSQEISYALLSGAGAATLGVLGFTVIALSEVALLAVLAGVLLFVSPWAAMGAITFFAFLALVLQRTMGVWSSRVGAAMASTDINSLNAIQEAIGAYREITVSNRRSMYVDRIQALRWEAAKVAANWQFIAMLPKYIFEAALVVGGFALAGVLFATQDSISAVGTLALFLAAGSRIMPSLLRLQGATLGLRGIAATAGPTFALAGDLGNLAEIATQPVDDARIRDLTDSRREGFAPSVVLDSVCLTYPGATSPSLYDISLRVEPGQSLALVGRSGAGKSTMSDVILGVLEPDSGSVLVGGQRPTECVSRWPGSVAYVPQDVLLANDTVRANVALGLPAQAIDDDLVWEALERAHFAEYVRANREGLDTMIGENGARLSGGQRQRLGIARALYTRPGLLVLDEATSALDAETEQSIARMIDDLEGDVTTIVVAHRLSTVRDVDVVVYLEQGRVVASGTFREVLKMVPAFERQAALMGVH